MKPWEEINPHNELAICSSQLAVFKAHGVSVCLLHSKKKHFPISRVRVRIDIHKQKATSHRLFSSCDVPDAKSNWPTQCFFVFFCMSSWNRVLVHWKRPSTSLKLVGVWHTRSPVIILLHTRGRKSTLAKANQKYWQCVFSFFTFLGIRRRQKTAASWFPCLCYQTMLTSKLQLHFRPKYLC